MLHRHNLTVAGQQALVPWQRQVHRRTHGHQQLLLHFRRAKAPVARVQRLGHLLVLPDRDGPFSFVLLGIAAGAALCRTLRENVLQVVVGILVASGNVDELGVLVAAAAELFVLELRDGRYV